jgi:hypothetical protein
MMIHGMYIIKETKFKVIQNEYNQINLHIIISSNGKIRTENREQKEERDTVVYTYYLI